LTALPRLEDIPRVGDGLDAERVREAFDAFRRHAAQMQAQLRVIQAAGQRPGPQVEPTGHAVRMDALHLIRAAAEFADTIERDAQTAAASQLSTTEEEVRRRQRDLQEREAELERFRQESERQRAEMLTLARNEVRELRANAERDVAQELREAEARSARLLEQSRHQATELTNAARAEVEQTLEWARAQASTILARAQHGAEQLLAAAGLGQDAIAQVAEAIVRAAEQVSDAQGAVRPQAPMSPAAALSGAPSPAPPAPPASAPPLPPAGPPVSGPPTSEPAPPAPDVEPTRDEDSGETPDEPRE
jgi:cell division septum initiation protein DivIVA